MRTHQSGPPKLLLRGLLPLALVCAIGSGAIAYHVLNQPLTQWRQGLVAKTDTARTCLAQGPELRRRHHEGTTRLEALQKRAERVNRLVPDEPQETEFLATLNQLAITHEVTIEDFRSGKRTSGATHSTVVVSVRAQGPYRGLCQLVDGVAKLPRLVELTRMTIEGKPGHVARPAKLEFALYYGITPPTDGPLTR